MKKITLQYKDIFWGNLILVNEDYPLSSLFDLEKEEGHLTEIEESSFHVFLEKRAAAVLTQMLKKIAGKRKIIPISGYRSEKEQVQIWKDTLKEKGEVFTKKFVALPGHSEHQTGLAVDLGLKKEEIDFICPDFPYEGICQQFRKLAPEYGFIERYEKDKELITKIAHEPWHFRYVGYPHSKIMKQKAISLEEYVERLKGYSAGKKYLFEEGGRQAAIFFVPVFQKKKVQISIPEESEYEISGNNVDGCIVTIWRNQDNE